MTKSESVIVSSFKSIPPYSNIYRWLTYDNGKRINGTDEMRLWYFVQASRRRRRLIAVYY